MGKLSTNGRHLADMDTTLTECNYSTLSAAIMGVSRSNHCNIDGDVANTDLAVPLSRPILTYSVCWTLRPAILTQS